jgi:hypothetical protein
MLAGGQAPWRHREQIMKPVAAIAAALLALGCAGNAAAQAPAPASQTVDPAKLELARQVFAANGGVEAFKTQMNAMFSGMSQMMRASVPAGGEKLADAIVRNISDEELKLIPSLVDLSAEVYAENLSQQELRDLLAWANSESGRSIRQKMPQVTQQLMVRMVPMMQAMMPSLMQKTLDRACAEAKCTPEVRKVVAEALDKATKPKGS